MVICTSSRRLASFCLNSVAREALTVKSVWFCSTFENENTLDCFSTAAGGAGGASFLTWRACHTRCTYTTATIHARKIAAPADHRAYLAASLVLIVRVGAGVPRRARSLL